MRPEDFDLIPTIRGLSTWPAGPTALRRFRPASKKALFR